MRINHLLSLSLILFLFFRLSCFLVCSRSRECVDTYAYIRQRSRERVFSQAHVIGAKREQKWREQEEKNIVCLRCGGGEHMLGSECKCIQEVLAFSSRHWTPVARNVAAASTGVVGNDRVTVTISEYGEKIWWDRTRGMSRCMKYRCRETASSARNSLPHAKMLLSLKRIWCMQGARELVINYMILSRNERGTKRKKERKTGATKQVFIFKMKIINLCSKISSKLRLYYEVKISKNINNNNNKILYYLSYTFQYEHWSSYSFGTNRLWYTIVAGSSNIRIRALREYTYAPMGKNFSIFEVIRAQSSLSPRNTNIRGAAKRANAPGNYEAFSPSLGGGGGRKTKIVDRSGDVSLRKNDSG